MVGSGSVSLGGSPEKSATVIEWTSGRHVPKLKYMTAWQEFLSSSPDICGGEICATGTRIPVTVILDSLAEGATKDEVLASYPSLRLDHINAALAYAAELAHEERLVPIRAR